MLYYHSQFSSYLGRWYTKCMPYIYRKLSRYIYRILFRLYQYIVITFIVNFVVIFNFVAIILMTLKCSKKCLRPFTIYTSLQIVRFSSEVIIKIVVKYVVTRERFLLKFSNKILNLLTNLPYTKSLLICH